MNGPSTTINLTAARRGELEAQIQQTKERKVADRMRVVLYKAEGHSHKLGFSYKKNCLAPSQADPELQRQFVQWLAGLHQHMKPEDRLYFGDAVHFKHNAEAGYAWSEVGDPHRIPANTGRQRYNVLGAYCLHTHDHR